MFSVLEAATIVLTVDVVGVLPEDVLVEFLGPVELIGGLIQACQVVGGGDRDSAVVGLIMLRLLA